MFLLPGIVFAWYITNTPIPEEYKIEMTNYLYARQHPEEGGWGLHIEGESTAFGTSMNYTAMRILGQSADDPRMIKARACLHKLGGAVCAPHWAMFWFSVMGITKWDIVNPIPPEFWLLPDWLPFAPWRWWIHVRMVYLPSSFIYSKRWTMPETQLIQELRQEIFTEPYEKINFAAHRNSICPRDNYHPKSLFLNMANWALANVWNPYIRPNWIKERAEDWTYKLVEMEGQNTDFADLAPVSAPMNMLVCYIRDGPEAYGVTRRMHHFEDYLWVKAEGMLVNGTNGVQVWDTAFVIQAVVDAGLAEHPRWIPMLTKALDFLDKQQIRENVVDQEICYRQQCKGGWAFSNKLQGYVVSDCVSEALKSVLLLQSLPSYPKVLEDQRIYDSINTMLTFQNSTGGIGSYEQRRGSTLLEYLNAAEVFGRIMVEYDYPECTTAVVTALSLFSKHYPHYRTAEIKAYKAKALKFIRNNQDKDGSWYGSWGICFTYATMFALESLHSVGETYTNSPHARKGVEFLLSKQREDGGWSESFKSSETMVYTEHESGSLVVQTAWALLGLMYAEYPDPDPIERGIRLLMSRQQRNGEWLAESIEGVFNKSTMITYQNYKFTFPIMAMGRWARLKEGWGKF
jgi:lanosterol synthase